MTVCIPCDGQPHLARSTTPRWRGTRAAFPWQPGTPCAAQAPGTSLSEAVPDTRVECELPHGLIRLLAVHLPAAGTHLRRLRDEWSRLMMRWHRKGSERHDAVFFSTHQAYLTGHRSAYISGLRCLDHCERQRRNGRSRSAYCDRHAATDGDTYACAFAGHRASGFLFRQPAVHPLCLSRWHDMPRARDLHSE